MSHRMKLPELAREVGRSIYNEQRARRDNGQEYLKVNLPQISLVLRHLFRVLKANLLAGIIVQVMGFGKFETFRRRERRFYAPGLKTHIVKPPMDRPRLTFSKPIMEAFNAKAEAEAAAKNKELPGA